MYYSRLRKKLKDFKNLTSSRKLSAIFLIVSIIISQIIMVISSLAISSSVQTINEIYIPAGLVNINFDTQQQDDMILQIPYQINNHGFFDLTQLKVRINLELIYFDNSTQMNSTLNIFNKDYSLAVCKGGCVFYGILEGYYDDYNISALDLFFDWYDNSEPADWFWVLADFLFSAKYYFELIIFELFMLNILIY